MTVLSVLAALGSADSVTVAREEKQEWRAPHEGGPHRRGGGSEAAEAKHGGCARLGPRGRVSGPLPAFKEEQTAGNRRIVWRRPNALVFVQLLASSVTGDGRLSPL